MSIPSKVDSTQKKRRTTESCGMLWAYDGRLYTVIWPKGYAYEVSIPRPLRALTGVLWPAYALEDVSCPHDALYMLHSYHEGRIDHPGLRDQCEEMRVIRDAEAARLTRREADSVLLSGEDPAALRLLAWAYVRAFGWWAWHDVGTRLRNSIGL